jgi:ribosome-binding protein aMBF1 (putative translation factor)
MEEKQVSSDAFGLIYSRYIKDDPERIASFREELAKAEIASEIYDLRHQAGLSRAQLADIVGVKETVIEDIEESDYEGDFLSMASRIATALHRKLEVHLVPVEEKDPATLSA